MKVLCVGRELNGGGAERAQMEFVREARRLGIAVEAVYLRRGGNFLDEAQGVLGATFVLEENQSLIRNALRLLWALYRAAQKCDVVFGMQDGTPIYLAAIAARLAGRPCVGWIHNMPFEHAYFFGWHKLAIPIFYRSLRKIICETRFQMQEWQAAVGKLGDRFCAVYPPMNLDRARQMGQEPLPTWTQKHRNQKMVLALGRLVPWKRHDLLIRAMACLRASRSDVSLIILGSGPFHQHLVDLAESLGVGEVTSIEPFDANPYRFLSHCDVLVVPSLWENFGTVAAEAFIFGKPVVATTSWKGFPEVVGDDSAPGLGLITADTPEALAEGIKTAIDQTNDGDLPIQRKRRAECFDASRGSEMVLAVLSGVLLGSKDPEGRTAN
jgi:glycosyltransferase involved in cell wall biosynthesis